MIELFLSLLIIAGVMWVYWKIRSKPRGMGKSKAKVVTKTGEGPSGSLPGSSTKGNQPIRVKRREIPYWKKRGWKRRNGNLEGYFRTKYGSFKGKVKSYRRNPTVYIYDPPSVLKNHNHWACFQPRGEEVFEIHFSKQRAMDAGAAIESVEKIIKEAFEK